MLREIDKDIWVAEQPLKYFGLDVGTRMTVIRLNKGELTIISPIQTDNALVAQLNQLGQVTYVICPNLYHHLFVKYFQNIYPQAKVWATSGLEIKRPELQLDKIISNEQDNILNEIDCLLFNGFKTLTLNGASLLNECVFFHRASRSLILTDTAFHFDENFTMTTQLTARIMGGYKQLRPSLLEKLATTEKDRVKQSVERVLAWNFERVIMAHGSIIEKDGKTRFKEGYEWFLGTRLEVA